MIYSIKFKYCAELSVFMFDLLLINPPYTKKGGNIWKTVASCMPPRSLAILAACFEKDGKTVKILDTHAECLAVDDMEKFLGANYNNPRFIGFTGTTVTIHHAYAVAEVCKRLWPKTNIVFGGYHASSKPAECIQQPFVDFVIRGDGEEAFLEIVNGVEPAKIKNLTYIDEKKKIIHNPEREMPKDLDIYPIPAYHLLPLDKYFPAVGVYKRLPAISVVTSRGCPGKCTFCYQPYGKNLRWHSAERVFEEVKLLVTKYGYHEICFYDDNFATNKARTRRICELFLGSGLDIVWSCFSRVDWADAELLKLMKKAGCHQVMFGAESGDQTILDGMRKQVTIERIRQAVQWTKDAGLDCRAAFLFGMPGETEATMKKTIEFALELDPDIAQFNIATPNPGTQLYDWAEKNGYLRSEQWEDYDWASPVLVLPTVDAELIKKYYKLAYKKFYMRPRYILKRLGKLRSFEDVKNAARAVRSVIDVTAH